MGIVNLYASTVENVNGLWEPGVTWQPYRNIQNRERLRRTQATDVNFINRNSHLRNTRSQRSMVYENPLQICTDREILGTVQICILSEQPTYNSGQRCTRFRKHLKDSCSILFFQNTW